MKKNYSQTEAGGKFFIKMLENLLEAIEEYCPNLRINKMAREDIIQNDARKIPLEDSSVDFVFINSPYSDNVKYSDHLDCIGKISCEKLEFFEELEKVAQEIHRILKPEKVMVWLIGDHWRKKSGFIPVGIKMYERLCKHFETVDIVCVTRRNQTPNTGLWYKRAREFNFYLRGFKYLFIMKKTRIG